MKNWNTDKFSFKSADERQIWEFSQLINYGLGKQRLSIQKLKSVWKKLEPNLDRQRARMLKYLIWGKLSLLSISRKYWGLSPKTTL